VWKYTESYVGKDMMFVATRTFDIDPRLPNGSFQTGTTNKIVIGNSDVRHMAKEEPEIKNPRIYTDAQVPVLWYSINGSLVEQRDFLIYEILPDLLINRQQNNVQIIWIPSHENPHRTNFRADIIEILDGVVKLKGFNIHNNTKFKIGLARSWFGFRKESDRPNVKIEQLNLAIEISAYQLIKCRVVNLKKFTTTDRRTPHTVPLKIVTHTNFDLDPRQYKTPKLGGFRLSGHALRRARQELRFYFQKLTVCPPWSQALRTREVYPPYMVLNGFRKDFPKFVRGKVDVGDVLRMRAKLRTEFVKSKGMAGLELDLPPIPEYDWNTLNISTVSGDVGNEALSPPILSPENQVEQRNLKGFNRENFSPSVSIQRFVKKRSQPKVPMLKYIPPPALEVPQSTRSETPAPEVPQSTRSETPVPEVVTTSEEEDFVVVITEQEMGELEVEVPHSNMPNRSLDDVIKVSQDMDWAAEVSAEKAQVTEDGSRGLSPPKSRRMTPSPMQSQFSDVSSAEMDISYQDSDEEVLDRMIQEKEIKIEREERSLRLLREQKVRMQQHKKEADRRG